MDIKKLIALSTVVQTGSINKASAILNYTQPGLTGMLNRLEKELDCTLLERTSNGITLTSKGHELMPYIEKIIDANEEFRMALYQLSDQDTRVLRIGAYTSILRNWLPKIIKEFKVTYPDIELVIYDGDVTEICQWIADETIDIGILGNPVDSEIEFIPLMRDCFYAVLPPTSSVGEVMDIHSFEDTVFLIPSFGTDVHVLQLLEDNHVKPQFLSIKTEDIALVKMVAQGLGSTILAELVLTGCTDNVNLVPIDPPAYREIGIGLKSYKKAPHAVKDFISCMEKHVSREQ